MPFSPWQAAHACARSSIVWAITANGIAVSRTANSCRCRVGRAKRSIPTLMASGWGVDTLCPPCPLLSSRCGEEDRDDGFSLSPLAGRGKGRGRIGLPCPSGQWEETPTRGFDLIGLKSLQREGDDSVA